MTMDDNSRLRSRSYAIAAEKRTLEAGFDGVPIHGGRNGYLVDQIPVQLQPTCVWTSIRWVHPKTVYGWYSEVVPAVVKAIGGDKVGTRF